MQCLCGLFRIEAEVCMWDDPPSREHPYGLNHMQVDGYHDPLLAQGAVEGTGEREGPWLCCPVCGTQIQVWRKADDDEPTEPGQHCSAYCEHNADGECGCQGCVFIRTNTGFEHAPGCPFARCH